MSKGRQLELHPDTVFYRPALMPDITIDDGDINTPGNVLAVFGVERTEEGSIAVYQHEYVRRHAVTGRLVTSVGRVTERYQVDHEFMHTRAGSWWIFPTLFTAAERGELGFRERPVYLEDREVGEAQELTRYLVYPGGKYRLDTVAPVLLAFKEKKQTRLSIKLLHAAVARAKSCNSLQE